ncbi:MAG: hypothetical protein HY080_10465 [Gammaproteobacteria bacterium]|nr:hypothetical protein [Gammaproteobacteria bacterium]
MKIVALVFIPCLSLATSTLWANQADVIDVQVSKVDANHYDFEVTVKHDDTGWEHYADKWEILGPDDKIIATRELAHPHVGEQPFMRSLENVTIPSGVTTVTVRAHDKQHGYGGKTVTVKLP